MSTTSSTYGRQIEPSEWNRERSLIQSPSLSGAGNVILRIGREWERGGSWHQTEHVVLLPDEAASLTIELGILQDERYVDKMTLGTLVFGCVPEGTDIDRLALALEHSTLPEVIADVAAPIVERGRAFGDRLLAEQFIERQDQPSRWKLVQPDGLHYVVVERTDGEHVDEGRESVAESRFERMDAVEVNAEAGRIIGEDKVPADELRELLRTYGEDEDEGSEP